METVILVLLLSEQSKRPQTATHLSFFRPRIQDAVNCHVHRFDDVGLRCLEALLKHGCADCTLCGDMSSNRPGDTQDSLASRLALGDFHAPSLGWIAFG